MKRLKIIIISLIMALLVYGGYLWIRGQQKSLSPIPEEGIKVIQISPNEQ